MFVINVKSMKSSQDAENHVNNESGDVLIQFIQVRNFNFMIINHFKQLPSPTKHKSFQNNPMSNTSLYSWYC